MELLTAFPMDFESGIDKKSKKLETIGNETTMNLNTMLHSNILASNYFKNLYDYKTWSEVMSEIKNEVTSLEPFLKGTIPSTAFCVLYKLWTLRLTVKQLQNMITSTTSPYARAIAFLYLRYVCKADQLWEWFEPYLEDDEEVTVEGGPRPRTTTIGKMVNDLLTQQKWVGTVLPRIPVPIARDIEKKLKERQSQTKANNEGADDDDYVMEDPKHATAEDSSRSSPRPRSDADGHRSPPPLRSRDSRSRSPIQPARRDRSRDRERSRDKREYNGRDYRAGFRDRDIESGSSRRDDYDGRDRRGDSRDRHLDRRDRDYDRRDYYRRDRDRYDGRRSPSPRHIDREEEELRRKRAEAESKRRAQERLESLKKIYG
ncbi:hypothetical protein SeMB42_g02332 [Synchytrium endobioticum]|uniref:Pre-mRNA-splicing factor 38 n=1 Tax=Synchytrium endobioticum TaxID=286115 RepID=A0A507D5R3_9FUNG|nr:hypothetical protein SeLEV6574_g03122 [Synchytrium endobioticum]TPX50219.1 hypothetical protein SeMB42_g02332 [Synchytrium endobioticum]